MDRETFSFANSPLLLILCVIPILLVIVQACIFLSRAWKEAGRIGIDKSVLKKVVVNSAVFSIMPSLPIIIIMAVLMPALGKYIPWLRLSVIGSAFYENMAADISVKAFGLSGIADSAMTPSIFLSVVWVMTLGIISYPLLNILGLKRFDQVMTSMKKKGGFIEYAVPALFLGVLSIFATPILANIKNPTGITTIIVSGISVLCLEKIAKKTGLTALRDFSFPISMLIAMATALPFSRLFAQLMA